MRFIFSILLLFSCVTIFAQGQAPDKLQGSPYKNGIMVAIQAKYDQNKKDTVYLYKHVKIDSLISGGADSFYINGQWYVGGDTINLSGSGTDLDSIFGNEFGNHLVSGDSLFYRECPTCGYDFVAKINKTDSIYGVTGPTGTDIFLRDGEGSVFILNQEKYLDGYQTTVGGSILSPNNQKRANLSVYPKNGFFIPPDYGFNYDDSNYNELGDTYIRSDSLFNRLCQECDELFRGIIDTSALNELGNLRIEGDSVFYQKCPTCLDSLIGVIVHPASIINVTDDSTTYDYLTRDTLNSIWYENTTMNDGRTEMIPIKDCWFQEWGLSNLSRKIIDKSTRVDVAFFGDSRSESYDSYAFEIMKPLIQKYGFGGHGYVSTQGTAGFSLSTNGDWTGSGDFLPLNASGQRVSLKNFGSKNSSGDTIAIRGLYGYDQSFADSIYIEYSDEVGGGSFDYEVGIMQGYKEKILFSGTTSTSGTAAVKYLKFAIGDNNLPYVKMKITSGTVHTSGFYFLKKSGICFHNFAKSGSRASYLYNDTRPDVYATNAEAIGYDAVFSNYGTNDADPTQHGIYLDTLFGKYLPLLPSAHSFLTMSTVVTGPNVAEHETFNRHMWAENLKIAQKYKAAAFDLNCVFGDQIKNNVLANDGVHEYESIRERASKEVSSKIVSNVEFLGSKTNERVITFDANYQIFPSGINKLQHCMPMQYGILGNAQIDLLHEIFGSQGAEDYYTKAKLSYNITESNRTYIDVFSKSGLIYAGDTIGIEFTVPYVSNDSLCWDAYFSSAFGGITQVRPTSKITINTTGPIDQMDWTSKKIDWKYRTDNLPSRNTSIPFQFYRVFAQEKDSTHWFIQSGTLTNKNINGIVKTTSVLDVQNSSNLGIRLGATSTPYISINPNNTNSASQFLLRGSTKLSSFYFADFGFYWDNQTSIFMRDASNANASMFKLEQNGNLTFYNSGIIKGNWNPTTFSVTGDIRLSDFTGSTFAGYLGKDVNGQIVDAATPVTSVTASSPLFSSGGTTPNITIQNGSTSQTGAITSTDWNTFNAKIGGSGTANQLAYFTGTGTIGGTSNMTYSTGTLATSLKYLAIDGAFVGGTLLSIDATNAQPLYIRNYNASSTGNAAITILGTPTAGSYVFGINEDISYANTLQNTFSNTNGSSLLEITSQNGDAWTKYGVSGSQFYSMGVDNSDSDKLRIQPGTTINTTTAGITMLTTGNTGIGIISPSTTLHVGGTFRTLGQVTMDDLVHAGSTEMMTVTTGGIVGYAPIPVGTMTSLTTNNGITGGVITGSGTIGLTGNALGVHNLATNGFMVRTSSGNVSARSLVQGTGISITNTDGVAGNPTITNSAPDQTVSITGAGITNVTGTYPNFTVTSTEVDGSTLNELNVLSLGAKSGITVPLNSSNSGGTINFKEGSGITLTRSTNDLTITSTGASVSDTTKWKYAGGYIQSKQNLALKVQGSSFDYFNASNQASLSVHANSSTPTFDLNPSNTFSQTSFYLRNSTGYMRLFLNNSAHYYDFPTAVQFRNSATSASAFRVEDDGDLTFYNNAGTSKGTWDNSTLYITGGLQTTGTNQFVGVSGTGTQMATLTSTGVLGRAAIPTGTVSSIATNNGITGGTITSIGTIGLTGQALALHNLASNGFIARTGSGTFAARTITAGTGISVANGDGVATFPTITNTGDLSNSNELTTSFSTSGNTITYVDAGGSYPVTVPNIYTINGTLTGNRILTQGTNSLTFSGTGITTSYAPHASLATWSNQVTGGGFTSTIFNTLAENSGFNAQTSDGFNMINGFGLSALYTSISSGVVLEGFTVTSNKTEQVYNDSKFLANDAGLQAQINGSYGTAGYVLKSGGSGGSMYWAAEGDLSNSNELNTAFSATNNVVSITDAGGTLNATVVGTIVNTYTSGATWTKPTGCKTVEVILIGGGGGGGSGAFVTPGSGSGGGGGGAGGYSETTLDCASISGTVSVTVGSGGSGGTNQTSSNNNGFSGSSGGNTSFGSYVLAGGGGGGGAGIVSANSSGGSSGLGVICDGGSGGGSTNTASFGTTGNAAKYASGGGNGGAGVTGSSGSGNGGGTGPTLAAAGSVTRLASGGSGGAAANPGGTGGSYGGGGGGGGAGRDNTHVQSGAGGTGGAGIAIIITHL